MSQLSFHPSRSTDKTVLLINGHIKVGELVDGKVVVTGRVTAYTQFIIDQFNSGKTKIPYKTTGL